MTILRIQTPRVFQPLLEPARYKGGWGGRGSGKSHFFAESLVERCVLHPGTRWACVREVQRSLKQSVKRLIEDKIQKLGVGPLFVVKEAEIVTPGGGVLIFEGLQDHTADSIKSLEGFDGAWVEEAQSLSQRSLDLLRPTIRKDGSELWFSWNPGRETDPVDALLRGENPPPGAIVVRANFSDNPWFPDVLRAEMEYDRGRDPDKYAHIWLGEYERNSERRVFKNWRIEEFERPEGTIFRQGADWGFATDPSVLVRTSIEGNRLYFDYEAYAIGCEIINLPELFMTIPDAEKWPITADSARPETISHMQKHGFPKIRPAIKGPKSIEDGIEWMKSFDIIVHPRCRHLIDELTLYSYKVDPKTEEVLPILEDRFNHCIAEGALVACERGDIPIEEVTTSDRVLTRGGYRRVLFAGVTDTDRETVVVATSLGSVRCTPDHEIYTSRGFVRADALRYDDEIINLRRVAWWLSASYGTAAVIDGIRRAVNYRIAAISSAVSRAALRGFIVMCGSFTSARFPLDLRFTTSTGMAGITTSETSNCSLLPSMQVGIRSATGGVSGSADTWTESARRQVRGIAARRAANCIAVSEWQFTLHSSRRQNDVPTVRNGSCRERSATRICIAAMRAGLLPVVLRELMTKLVSVSRAALSLWRTGIARSKLVRGRVETLSEAKPCARVYDLTVEEHHEFFAGGVLVSNCIDAARYSVEGARRASPRRTENRPRRERNWRTV